MFSLEDYKRSRRPEKSVGVLQVVEQDYDRQSTYLVHEEYGIRANTRRTAISYGNAKLMSIGSSK